MGVPPPRDQGAAPVRGSGAGARGRRRRGHALAPGAGPARRRRGGGRAAALARAANLTLDRLERAEELQRRFAADASHELRTPITGLRTRIEVALADIGGTDLVATLGDALGDAERLQRIVDDLLVLTRLDAGEVPARTPLDLTSLVRSHLAQQAGCQTRVTVSSLLEGGVEVDVDRLQMNRVLVSLLSNATRHAAEKVEVVLRADRGDAELEIRDDGPGIADRDRERIFGRFARVDSARSRDRGGSGLGLAVAREIVEAHGGSLVAAASERGARLVVRLPRHTEPGDEEEGDEDDRREPPARSAGARTVRWPAPPASLLAQLENRLAAHARERKARNGGLERRAAPRDGGDRGRRR